VNLTLKMAEYMLKGLDGLMGTDSDARRLCQKKHLTMFEKALSSQKAIKDRKQGRVTPASRKKASAFETGIKNA
jgi:hypothetical protein